MRYTLLLFLFTTTMNFAQEFKLNEVRHVVVRGTATMEVVPNIIKIRVTLEERYIGKQKLDIVILDSKFNSIIQNLNIDPTNITLDEFSSDYSKYRRKRADVFASKDYVVTLDDITVATQLLKQLNEADFESFMFSKSHTDIISYRKQVKANAVKASKEKAIYLLEAVDGNIGKLLVLKELVNEDAEYKRYRNAMNGSNSYSPSASTMSRILGGFDPILVSYSMDATFEIID